MSERDRWAELDELLDGALEQPPEARSEWLARACGGDEVLRSEVGRLIALAVTEDERVASSGAMAGPLWEEVAAYLEAGEEADRLRRGETVASYEILELIGVTGFDAELRRLVPPRD